MSKQVELIPESRKGMHSGRRSSWLLNGYRMLGMSGERGHTRDGSRSVHPGSDEAATTPFPKLQTNN
ncbi:hypothetical protein LB504_011492 [Fusarium proliferatum]|nr:hypothetical protein LB504_011492 [Fusarium proliferatum]